MQHFAIPNEDLFAIDSKLCNTKLSHECLLKLSANCLDQEMFATFDYIQPSYDLRGINSGDLNSTIKDFHSKFQISPKLLHKNKPDIQTKKESETKESNNEVSKPNYIQAPYNQIQIHSEDDSERISMDILSKDDPNFMIPNEGNINKSPLSLLTKATRTNVFCINAPHGRDKSLSVNSYAKLVKDNRLVLSPNGELKEDYIKDLPGQPRTVTPQQKHNLYSNLIEKRKSKFESVNQKLMNKKVQRFAENSEGRISKPTYSKRSHTIKDRCKADGEFRQLHGVHLTENHPQIIAKIRQSPELGTLTEQEDFGFNDIDEKVTSHKKSILQRNIDWKNDSNLNIKFPDLSDKESNDLKQHISKLQKDYLIPKKNKIASTSGLSSHGVETKSQKRKLKQNKEHQQPKYTVITHIGENKREENNKNIISKETEESLEQSPENLKLSGDYRDKWKHSDVFYVINPVKASLPDQVTRNSNPIKVNHIETQIDQQIDEINKISESPEYKNSRYTLATYKNTFVDNPLRYKDVEEYNLFESPQEGSAERINK